MSKHNKKLLKASEKGDVAGIQAALRDKANVNAFDKWGSTPLHLASRNGHADAIMALLAGGADVNADNWYGWTPLHSASENGHVDAVKALLDAGADPTIAAEDGKRPIDVVCTFKYIKEANKANAPAIAWVLRAEMAWRRRKAAVCSNVLGLWWG